MTIDACKLLMFYGAQHHQSSIKKMKRFLLMIDDYMIDN